MSYSDPPQTLLIWHEARLWYTYMLPTKMCEKKAEIDQYTRLCNPRYLQLSIVFLILYLKALNVIDRRVKHSIWQSIISVTTKAMSSSDHRAQNPGGITSTSICTAFNEKIWLIKHLQHPYYMQRFLLIQSPSLNQSEILFHNLLNLSSLF